MSQTIIGTIWNAMGWCPMEASIRYPETDVAGRIQKKDTMGDGGPVARRSARFMRLTWALIIISWITAFLVMPYLPEVIPVHWDLNGQPDGFSNRLPGTFGVPVIITLITILLIILPRFDSMQFSLESFRDIYAMMIFATIAMLFGLEVIVLLIAAGTDLPVASLMSVLIGFLFIVMGSLMPHIGRNTTMGFRLPWTLKNEEVWKKTHEHGGPVLMVSGVLVVLGSLAAGTRAFTLMLVIVIITSLYMVVWSYRLAQSRSMGLVPAQDP